MTSFWVDGRSFAFFWFNSRSIVDFLFNFFLPLGLCHYNFFGRKYFEFGEFTSSGVGHVNEAEQLFATRRNANDQMIDVQELLKLNGRKIIFNILIALQAHSLLLRLSFIYAHVIRYVNILSYHHPYNHT